MIKLQMDFFISLVTAFRFSSTCWSLGVKPVKNYKPNKVIESSNMIYIFIIVD